MTADLIKCLAAAHLPLQSSGTVTDADWFERVDALAADIRTKLDEARADERAKVLAELMAAIPAWDVSTAATEARACVARIAAAGEERVSTDADWAMRSMACVGLIPKASVFAEFRAEVDAAARADERLRVLAEIAPPAAWTTTPPTGPGKFWVRCPGDPLTRVVEVFDDSFGQGPPEWRVSSIGSEVDRPLSDYSGCRWAGPLVAP